MSRPPIPRPLRRKVKEEAGHRCAIITCRAFFSVDVAHIVPYEKVQEHAFENLILLCKNCHWLFDQGQIDRQSIENYKLSLSIVNHRYSDFERRVIEYFVDNGNGEDLELQLPFHQDFHLRNLLRDNLLRLVHRERHIASGIYEDGIEVYMLTPTGHDFVHRWVTAKNLDEQIPEDEE